MRRPATVVVALTTLWTLVSAATLWAGLASESLVTAADGRLVPATAWDAAAEATATAGTVVQPAVFVLAALAAGRPRRAWPWLLAVGVALVPAGVVLGVAAVGSGARTGLVADAGAGLVRWALLMLAIGACGALAGLAARHHLPSVAVAAVVVPTAVALRASLRDISSAPAALAELPALARESVLLGGTRLSSAGGEAYVGAVGGGAYLVVLMLVAAALAAAASGGLRVLRKDDPDRDRGHEPPAGPGSGPGCGL